MYELGILLFPNDILDLAMIHNSSFFPLDCKPRGYSTNDRHFFIYFDSDEFRDKRAVPLSAHGDQLRVGGNLIEKPLDQYQTIAIEWGQVFKMMRQHVANIPPDAELVAVQVKQKLNPGDICHLFRLVFKTNQKTKLEFGENGQPKDFRILPKTAEGKTLGELRYIGCRVQ